MQKFKKNKKILLVLLVSIVVITLATSTAYMLMNILPSINDPQKMGVTTDKLVLSYTDCADNNRFHCENINKDLGLGESVVKTFQIKNESKSKMTYTLYFKHLQNTFKNDELVYKIENIDTGEVLIDTTPVPYRELKTANVVIKKNQVIEGKTTQNYKMTVTFLNKDYNQNENLSAKYSIKLSIVLANQRLTESISNELMKVTSNYNEKIWQHKGDIKKIVFEDTLNPKENASYIYDISSSENESVMSYLVPDTEDETKYIAYIQSEGETVANKNSSFLFYNFTSLETIDNLKNLNTSNVTNMGNMFTRCNSLTTLYVTSFDTKNVTNMNWIFQNCSSLTELDVSHFDTSNVTDMRGIFAGCSSLKTLDVSNFDTSKCTNMYDMFYYCSSLTTLDLSNFDTSSVTNMSDMFNGCKSLVSLDVSNFNTINVTDMSIMFSGCSSLTILNVSNFNTSKVTNMRAMFNGCSSLTALDVSNFVTSNVTNMNAIFMNCSNLKTLDLSHFDTNHVTDMGLMFSQCHNLTTLSLHSFNTSNLTNMYQMFTSCQSLTSLDVSNFDTNNVTNMSGIFQNCSKLENLILFDVNINSTISKQDMIYGVLSTIRITIPRIELKQWLIDTSDNPKLTDSNFTII